MMFYNSSNNNNNNNNTSHCNAHNTHSVGNVIFELDCSCNTISNCSCRRTAASTLTSLKQRSSSSGCKKYRRAKLLGDAISCCNNNSSYIGKPYLPAFTPTTATATVAETAEAFSESASSAIHNGSTHRRRRSTAYCNLAASSPALLYTVLATVFGICRALSLPLCLLLLLRLTPAVRCLAVGVETANVNITDLGSPAIFSFGMGSAYAIMVILLFLQLFGAIWRHQMKPARSPPDPGAGAGVFSSNRTT